MHTSSLAQRTGGQAHVHDTLRTLAAQLADATPQLRASLKRLPVWVGDRWTSERPVYAIADESLAGLDLAYRRVQVAGRSHDTKMAQLLDRHIADFGRVDEKSATGTGPM